MTRLILEDAERTGQELHLHEKDLKRGYDTVSFWVVRLAYQKQGAPSDLIEVFASLFANRTHRTLTAYGYSEWKDRGFPGLGQGSVLACRHFVTATGVQLDYMQTLPDPYVMGKGTPMEQSIGGLAYVDDEQDISSSARGIALRATASDEIAGWQGMSYGPVKSTYSVVNGEADEEMLPCLHDRFGGQLGDDAIPVPVTDSGTVRRRLGISYSMHTTAGPAEAEVDAYSKRVLAGLSCSAVTAEQARYAIQACIGGCAGYRYQVAEVSPEVVAKLDSAIATTALGCAGLACTTNRSFVYAPRPWGLEILNVQDLIVRSRRRVMMTLLRGDEWMLCMVSAELWDMRTRQRRPDFPLWCPTPIGVEKGWVAETLRHEAATKAPMELHITAHPQNDVWYDTPLRTADMALARAVDGELYAEVVRALQNSPEQGALWVSHMSNAAGTELGTLERCAQRLRTTDGIMGKLYPKLRAALTNDGVALCAPVGPAPVLGIRITVTKGDWVVTTAVANVVQMAMVVSEQPTVVRGAEMVDVQFVGDVKKAAAKKLGWVAANSMYQPQGKRVRLSLMVLHKVRPWTLHVKGGRHLALIHDTESASSRVENRTAVGPYSRQQWLEVEQMCRNPVDRHWCTACMQPNALVACNRVANCTGWYHEGCIRVAPLEAGVCGRCRHIPDICYNKPPVIAQPVLGEVQEEEVLFAGDGSYYPPTHERESSSGYAVVNENEQTLVCGRYGARQQALCSHVGEVAALLEGNTVAPRNQSGIQYSDCKSALAVYNRCVAHHPVPRGSQTATMERTLRWVLDNRTPPPPCHDLGAISCGRGGRIR